MSQDLFSKLPQWLNYDQSDHMEKPIAAVVTGEIPRWIKGSLYRNGSGVYKMGSTSWNHIFDGFSVLQRWTFEDGKVTYQSSILDSDDYNISAKRNRIVGMGFGGTFPDPCQSIFGKLMSRFIPSTPEDVNNPAVNIMEWGDRLFALTETPVINEIQADTLSVKPGGKTVMPEYVAVHLGTAHPHMLKDGTMIYFGTNIMYSKAYNFISIPPQSPSSKTPFSGAKIIATAPSRWKANISYTHSFGMTENYFVHMEQPLTLNLPKLIGMAVTQSSTGQCILSHPGESLDILVVDKVTGKRTPITYRAPNGFVFHFVNCYEECNHIVCDVSFFPDGTEFIRTKYLEEISKRHPNYKCREKVYFARFVLPLSLNGAVPNKNLVTLPGTTATAFLEKESKRVLRVTPETFDGTPAAELPRINYDYNGVKYRYFYASSAFIQDCNQLSKFDLQEKRVVTYEVEENITPGEPVFLARPGATKEDDGVILCTLVADNSSAQSSLVVLDAVTFKELARASLPTDVRMSFTFHGNFTEKTFCNKV